jgi:hypothetical protein
MEMTKHTAKPDVLSNGVVTRVVGDTLAYASFENGRFTRAFVPEAVEGFDGEVFKELRIVEGAHIAARFQPRSDIVTHITVLRTKKTPATAFRSVELEAQVPSRRPSARGPRYELLPEAHAKGTTIARRALPKATQSFGKLLDTEILWPGDLLLTRDIKPGRISGAITQVQANGGYELTDSRWTHAAMYLGDGESVVEATFENPVFGGSVRITKLDDYCQGSDILRFRRSNFIVDEKQGWRVCVRALSRLNTNYNLLDAATMWFNVVIMGRGFYGEKMHRSIFPAVVCSTLYADAYNEATRRSLGEVNGTCVPAWLSCSDEFTDLKVVWRAIQVANM